MYFVYNVNRGTHDFCYYQFHTQLEQKERKMKNLNLLNECMANLLDEWFEIALYNVWIFKFEKKNSDTGWGNGKNRLEIKTNFSVRRGVSCIVYCAFNKA